MFYLTLCFSFTIFSLIASKWEVRTYTPVYAYFGFLAYSVSKIVTSSNEIFFTFCYAQTYFQLKRIVRDLPYAKRPGHTMNSFMWIILQMTVTSYLLYGLSTTLYWCEGALTSYSNMASSAREVFSIIPIIFISIPCFVLIITIIKIWRLLRDTKFLRANEGSMIAKGIFGSF
jgi:hypothetical protein